MKLIVGLGNIGEKYTNTRHNVGFMFLDFLVRRLGDNSNFEEKQSLKGLILKTPSTIYLKPTTLMNGSGRSVALVSNYFGVETHDIIVIHDDLDIKLGSYKIQEGVGPALHNGISSIEEEIETENFTRVRIGVDNRDPLNRIPGEAYVLSNFSDTEIALIEETFPLIAKDIESVI